MINPQEYDVIIVGASFAGVAVANKIKFAKVLLVDQKEIGVGVKSACGTLLYMVKKLKLEEAVLQVHKKIILHTSQGALEYFLENPFCVINVEKFSQRLFQMGRARNLKARVEDFDGKVLKTDRGNFKARIFVDASGPKAVLSRRKRRSQQYLSFGIETILPYKERGLHFWYEPKIFKKGVFWLFPQGRTSRFGVGSYQGKTDLKPYLDEFLSRFRLKTNQLYGGYFPHYLRKPIENNIFLVGDAAGQCLPLTGEGIRPAIAFGQKCGEIIDKILLGKINLSQGLEEYENYVLKRRFYYRLMYWGQKFAVAIPESFFYPLAWLASQKPITSFILRRYLKIIEG